MMLPRFIVFVLAAGALAGCCASSSGCYVAVPGIPMAWDGAGARPDDGAPPRRPSTKRMARSKTEVAIGAIANARADAEPPSEQGWAQEAAAGRDADAKLAKQIMICRGCLPARDDDATGSAGMR
jgi:hypothetical protein